MWGAGRTATLALRMSSRLASSPTAQVASSPVAVVARWVGHTPRVAVVGAGPAGFYATQHIVKAMPGVQVCIVKIGTFHAVWIIPPPRLS